jgi:hypothetical protein
MYTIIAYVVQYSKWNHMLERWHLAHSPGSRVVVVVSAGRGRRLGQLLRFVVQHVESAARLTGARLRARTLVMMIIVTDTGTGTIKAAL